MKILYLLIAALKLMTLMVLILLLVLLLLITIILTVPIQYRVDIKKTENLSLYANIKWLYSIVSMDIIYHDNSKVTKTVRLFGKKIMTQKSKKNNMAKTKPYEEKQTINKATEIKKSELQQLTQKAKNVNQQTKLKKKVNNNKQKSKKKSGIGKIINHIQSLEYKKDLLADTIEWIGKFFKSIAPSKLYMYIEIGRDDPAQTGQIIAMLSALYPFYYPIATVVGNYEKECLYAKIDVTGQLSLGRFVYDFLKYMRTRSVKEFIGAIRENRKGKNNGRKTSK